MPIPLLIKQALRVRERHGIGLWRQLRQAAGLRFGAPQLDPWEYYFFEVFRDSFSPGEKRRFVGWRREIALDRAANAAAAREPANDKRLFHDLMYRHGLPHARIGAVFAPDGRGALGAECLHDTTGVARYLRNPDRYPLLIKPARGARGRNIVALRGWLESGDRLMTTAGQPIALTQFTDGLGRNRTGNFVLQEMLRPHPSTQEICGDRLTTARIIVTVAEKVPTILSAVWRVPTGTNVTDNFDCGRTGNIAAGIEPLTGRIERVVRGAGWQTFSLTHHPDTGRAFTGLQLPDWESMRQLCLDGARLLPGLRLQHWDIAVTDRGPVAIECNVAGGMRTHQLVQRRGIYDAPLRAISGA